MIDFVWFEIVRKYREIGPIKTGLSINYVNPTIKIHTYSDVKRKKSYPIMYLALGRGIGVRLIQIRLFRLFGTNTSFVFYKNIMAVNFGIHSGRYRYFWKIRYFKTGNYLNYKQSVTYPSRDNCNQTPVLDETLPHARDIHRFYLFTNESGELVVVGSFFIKKVYYRLASNLIFLGKLLPKAYTTKVYMEIVKIPEIKEVDVDDIKIYKSTIVNNDMTLSVNTIDFLEQANYTFIKQLNYRSGTNLFFNPSLLLDEGNKEFYLSKHEIESIDLKENAINAK